MIPEGWRTYNFSEIAELRKEQTAPNGEEQPYIGLEHIDQQSLRLNSIGSSKDVISNKYRFYPGDILYGKLRPYFRKVYQPKFAGVCSTDIYVIKNKDTIDKTLLFFLVALEEFTNIATSGSTGTRMPRADWSQLQKSVWTIPKNIDEQKKIASILSSLDDKIELNLRMNKTLETIAQDIFKEWFVDFRFPGSDSVLVNGLPKGWRKESLDNVAEFLNGLALQKYPPVNGEDNLPVIKIRELRQGISGESDRANCNLPPEYIVNNRDILFSWSGSLEVVIWCDGLGALNQHLFKVTSSDYPKWFYYLWTKFHLPKFQRIAESKATTMGHIQRHHLHEAFVNIPNPELMIVADRILSPLMDRFILCKLEINTITKLRDTILPYLMSGKIRVA
jgi:type I restriction enzyme, S subunit